MADKGRSFLARNVRARAAVGPPRRAHRLRFTHSGGEVVGADVVESHNGEHVLMAPRRRKGGKRPRVITWATADVDTSPAHIEALRRQLYAPALAGGGKAPAQTEPKKTRLEEGGFDPSSEEGRRQRSTVIDGKHGKLYDVLTDLKRKQDGVHLAALMAAYKDSVHGAGYAGLPSTARYHPLHNAVHHTWLAAVAFFLALGQDPSKTGTIWMFMGDNLPFKNGGSELTSITAAAVRELMAGQWTDQGARAVQLRAIATLLTIEGGAAARRRECAELLGWLRQREGECTLSWAKVNAQRGMERVRSAAWKSLGTRGFHVDDELELPSAGKDGSDYWGDGGLLDPEGAASGVSMAAGGKGVLAPAPQDAAAPADGEGEGELTIGQVLERARLKAAKAALRKGPASRYFDRQKPPPTANGDAELWAKTRKAWRDVVIARATAEAHAMEEAVQVAKAADKAERAERARAARARQADQSDDEEEEEPEEGADRDDFGDEDFANGDEEEDEKQAQGEEDVVLIDDERPKSKGSKRPRHPEATATGRRKQRLVYEQEADAVAAKGKDTAPSMAIDLAESSSSSDSGSSSEEEVDADDFLGSGVGLNALKGKVPNAWLKPIRVPNARLMAAAGQRPARRVIEDGGAGAGAAEWRRGGGGGSGAGGGRWGGGGKGPRLPSRLRPFDVIFRETIPAFWGRPSRPVPRAGAGAGGGPRLGGPFSSSGWYVDDDDDDGAGGNDGNLDQEDEERLERAREPFARETGPPLVTAPAVRTITASRESVRKLLERQLERPAARRFTYIHDGVEEVEVDGAAALKGAGAAPATAAVLNRLGIFEAKAAAGAGALQNGPPTHSPLGTNALLARLQAATQAGKDYQRLMRQVADLQTLNSLLISQNERQKRTGMERMRQEIAAAVNRTLGARLRGEEEGRGYVGEIARFGYGAASRRGLAMAAAGRAAAAAAGEKGREGAAPRGRLTLESNDSSQPYLDRVDHRAVVTSDRLAVAAAKPDGMMRDSQVSAVFDDYEEMQPPPPPDMMDEGDEDVVLIEDSPLSAPLTAPKRTWEETGQAVLDLLKSDEDEPELQRALETRTFPSECSFRYFPRPYAQPYCAGVGSRLVTPAQAEAIAASGRPVRSILLLPPWAGCGQVPVQATLDEDIGPNVDMHAPEAFQEEEAPLGFLPLLRDAISRLTFGAADNKAAAVSLLLRSIAGQLLGDIERTEVAVEVAGEEVRVSQLACDVFAAAHSAALAMGAGDETVDMEAAELAQAVAEAQARRADAEQICVASLDALAELLGAIEAWVLRLARAPAVEEEDEGGDPDTKALLKDILIDLLHLLAHVTSGSEKAGLPPFPALRPVRVGQYTLRVRPVLLARRGQGCTAAAAHPSWYARAFSAVWSLACRSRSAALSAGHGSVSGTEITALGRIVALQLCQVQRDFPSAAALPLRELHAAITLPGGAALEVHAPFFWSWAELASTLGEGSFWPELQVALLAYGAEDPPTFAHAFDGSGDALSVAVPAPVAPTKSVLLGFFKAKPKPVGAPPPPAVVMPAAALKDGAPSEVLADFCCEILLSVTLTLGAFARRAATAAAALDSNRLVSAPWTTAIALTEDIWPGGPADVLLSQRSCADLARWWCTSCTTVDARPTKEAIASALHSRVVTQEWLDSSPRDGFREARARSIASSRIAATVVFRLSEGSRVAFDPLPVMRWSTDRDVLDKLVHCELLRAFAKRFDGWWVAASTASPPGSGESREVMTSCRDVLAALKKRILRIAVPWAEAFLPRHPMDPPLDWEELTRRASVSAGPNPWPTRTIALSSHTMGPGLMPGRATAWDDNVAADRVASDALAVSEMPHWLWEAVKVGAAPGISALIGGRVQSAALAPWREWTSSRVNLLSRAALDEVDRGELTADAIKMQCAAVRLLVALTCASVRGLWAGIVSVVAAEGREEVKALARTAAESLPREGRDAVTPRAVHSWPLPYPGDTRARRQFAVQYLPMFMPAGTGAGAGAGTRGAPALAKHIAPHAWLQDVQCCALLSGLLEPRVGFAGSRLVHIAASDPPARLMVLQVATALLCIPGGSSSHPAAARDAAVSTLRDVAGATWLSLSALLLVADDATAGLASIRQGRVIVAPLPEPAAAGTASAVSALRSAWSATMPLHGSPRAEEFTATLRLLTAHIAAHAAVACALASAAADVVDACPDAGSDLWLRGNAALPCAGRKGQEANVIIRAPLVALLRLTSARTQPEVCAWHKGTGPLERAQSLRSGSMMRAATTLLASALHRAVAMRAPAALAVIALRADNERGAPVLGRTSVLANDAAKALADADRAAAEALGELSAVLQELREELPPYEPLPPSAPPAPKEQATPSPDLRALIHLLDRSLANALTFSEETTQQGAAFLGMPGRAIVKFGPLLHSDPFAPGGAGTHGARSAAVSAATRVALSHPLRLSIEGVGLGSPWRDPFSAAVLGRSGEEKLVVAAGAAGAAIGALGAVWALGGRIGTGNAPLLQLKAFLARYAMSAELVMALSQPAARMPDHDRVVSPDGRLLLAEPLWQLMHTGASRRDPAIEGYRSRLMDIARGWAWPALLACTAATQARLLLLVPPPGADAVWQAVSASAAAIAWQAGPTRTPAARLNEGYFLGVGPRSRHQRSLLYALSTGLREGGTPALLQALQCGLEWIVATFRRSAAGELRDPVADALCGVWYEATRRGADADAAGRERTPARVLEELRDGAAAFLRSPAISATVQTTEEGAGGGRDRLARLSTPASASANSRVVLDCLRLNL